MAQTFDGPTTIKRSGYNMVMVTENVKYIGRLNGIVVENWMEK